jgi:hypothetical protein
MSRHIIFVLMYHHHELLDLIHASPLHSFTAPKTSRRYEYFGHDTTRNLTGDIVRETASALVMVHPITYYFCAFTRYTLQV